jgi:predicted site-specific integrase-resolvase
MEAIKEMEYFNEKTLSSYIDTSPHTLKYWRKTGQGPKFITLPNGRIRYKRSDIEEYMTGTFNIKNESDYKK